MSKWFQPISHGRPVGGTLRTLHLRLKDYREDPSYRLLSDDGGNSEWICGLVIPPFQRDHVWTREQEIAFVNSARQGLPLGSYTYNVTAGMPEAHRRNAEGTEYFLGDLWLLDGMQRLTALQNFFDGQFAVEGRFFDDLDTVEKRVFLGNVHFPAYETALTDEHEMRVIYDSMNYGGTPHKEEERAIPKPRP